MNNKRAEEISTNILGAIGIDGPVPCFITLIYDLDAVRELNLLTPPQEVIDVEYYFFLLWLAHRKIKDKGSLVDYIKYHYYKDKGNG